jgi:hypothetical protein
MSDLEAGDASTTNVVGVDEAYVGAIDGAGDVDWVRVSLTAGVSYQLDLVGKDGGGGTLADSWLKLISACGTVLQANDDGSSIYDQVADHLHDSQIVFTPQESGTYYLSAEGFDAATGSYTVSVTPLAEDFAIQSLLYQPNLRWHADQTAGQPITVTYSFPASEPAGFASNELAGFTGLTVGQQQMAREVLHDIEEFTQLHFVESAGSDGQIRIAGSNQHGVSAGICYTDDDGTSLISADIALSTQENGYAALVRGSFMYFALVHEIGHALGLKHPGNYNAGGGGADGPYLPPTLDATPWTVETYNSNTAGWLDLGVNVFPFPRTMMSLDIAALQHLYGAKLSTNPADDTWRLDASATYTIVDTGGLDCIDATGITSSVTLDLCPGAISYLGRVGTEVLSRGLIPQLSISTGSQIENAIGTALADILLGNLQNNVLTGAGGNDRMEGFSGNDSFYGGDGSDTLVGGMGDDNLDGGSGADHVVYSGTQQSYLIVWNAAQSGFLVTSAFDGTDLLRDIETIDFADFSYALVPPVNKAPTGAVILTGMPSQGQTLTAANTLTDLDGIPTSGTSAITYQWLADGVAISGAIGSTLVLGQTQVGKAISVTASYTDLFGTAESKTSSAGTAVANVNDFPTGTVTLSGTPTQGQTLTAANTLLDLDGIPSTGTGAIAYQWLADGVAIIGAIGSALVLGQTQVGRAISVRASYTDLFGAAESKTSSATAAVVNVNDAPTGSVTISGIATQGQTLTAANALADLDGIPGTDTGAITYQWLADGVTITGATGSAFTVTAAQAGHVVSARTSYTDLFGTAESMTSASVNVAAAIVKPTLSGIAYDWNNHMLLQDVAVSVKGGGAPAEGANAPIQFKALSWNTSGHASAEVWSHASAAFQNFGFDLNISNASGISFRAAALPNTASGGGTDWLLTPNASGTTLSVAGITGISSAAIAAGDFKLGTITFETGSALLADLQLLSGDVGSSTASAYGLSMARASSSATGAFSISTLEPGSYDITASRAVTDIGNAITSADALAALKIAVGLNPNPDPDSTGPMSSPMLSPYQFMAADLVGTDGRVTSADALAILKMAVKLPTAPTKEWMFVEETRDFWNETTGQFTLSRNNAGWDHSISTTMQAGTTTGTVNLVGVLKGDVNGSWAAPVGSTDLDTIDPTHFTALSSIFGMPVGQFGV